MLSAILSLAAPAILGPAGLAIQGMSPMVASAIGGGLGKLIEGGSTQDVLQGAALGGLGSFLGGKLGGVDSSLAMTPASGFCAYFYWSGFDKTRGNRCWYRCWFGSNAYDEAKRRRRNRNAKRYAY